jgi:hypothetical protein
MLASCSTATLHELSLPLSSGRATRRLGASAMANVADNLRAMLKDKYRHANLSDVRE